MRFSVCLLPVAVLADPCARLCELDGPVVCTNGSYTKEGSVCNGYFIRGDPSSLDYCYLSQATESSCPSSGKPLDALIAYKLIALKEMARIRASEPTKAPSASHLRRANPEDESNNRSMKNWVRQNFASFPGEMDENRQFALEFVLNRLGGSIDESSQYRRYFGPSH